LKGSVRFHSFGSGFFDLHCKSFLIHCSAIQYLLAGIAIMHYGQSNVVVVLHKLYQFFTQCLSILWNALFLTLTPSFKTLSTTSDTALKLQHLSFFVFIILNLIGKIYSFIYNPLPLILSSLPSVELTWHFATML
jgi:hypothetical protein